MDRELIGMIRTVKTSSDSEDFASLVQLLDNDLWNRYPHTQQQYEAFNIIPNDAKVVVAYEEDNPVGCGCFRDPGMEDTIEIKRMYVKEDARGKGIATSILTALEAWARELGKKRSILETGTNQPEAVSLYAKLGYNEIEKYGPYAGSEESSSHSS